MNIKRKQRKHSVRTGEKTGLAVCRRYAWLFFLLLLPIAAIYQVANADETLLTSTKHSFFVGDSFLLSDYLTTQDVTEIQYNISESSEDSECITLDTTGKVTAVREGSAVITIEYKRSSDLQTTTESFSVTVYEPETLTASYGAQLYLSTFDVYDPSEYTYVYSQNSIALADDGFSVLVQGFQSASVYVQGTAGDILVAEITVIKPEFSQAKIARAVGTDAYSPEISNYKAIDGDTAVVYSIENEAVAVTASQSAISAKAVGTTTVYALITAKNGEQLTISAKFKVTDPQLTKSYVVVAVGGKQALPVSGMSSISTCELSESSSYAYITSKNKIQGSAQGTASLTLVIDGRSLKLKVIVTNPQYSSVTIPMYKGMSKTMKLSGINKKYSTVSFTSANKKVATVTKNGKIKAKKIGVTRVKVKADGKNITVCVQIAAKKAYQASRKEIAISKQKTQYSQVKRMQKGYYDCSSLVTRVYRQFGVYFGSKTGWAPTAADIGKWCASNHKVIARKGVSYTKLVPGDLLFYSYSGSNGRYLNIDHVDMYVGEGQVVSASSSRNKVVVNYYYSGSVVLVARPVR
ncbi:MAG: NlpC/P60 family protein [Clostridiaceae bacterium]|nr:NlpC/P60 family protein [Clostridiaceae bacterium]